MKELLFLPSFAIFLYMIFRLVRDDHVFFRRNIKTEHFFDYTFIVFFTVWFVIQFIKQNQSAQLVAAIPVASLVLLAISKYKKIPLGRFMDFFALSFLVSIPWWFLAMGLFLRNNESVIYYSKFLSYTLASVFFIKYLFPKTINRSLKEGSIAVFFIVLYSFVSLLFYVYSIFQNKSEVLSFESITVFLILISSIPLLIRMQR